MTRRGAPFIFDAREVGGALGDLGTLLPLMLGAVAVAGLAPVPVVAGFGLFYIASGLIYRLPIPVQPMKAVAAVLMTAGLAPEAVAASGVMLGLALLALGLTGLIDRLGRLTPQSVLAGLQLGLGLALGLAALRLMEGELWLGIAVAAALLALRRAPGTPAPLLVLAVASGVGAALGLPGLPLPEGAPAVAFAWPSDEAVGHAASLLALPQLTLTLTNAVLVTALVAQERFGAAAAHVTPRRLCLSSGVANLVLAPLGALPMCHGAGGLAAHHRFGARSGAATVMLGAALLALAALPGDAGLAVLAAPPAAALGALLLFAAWELAVSPRLFDARPSCRPVIAATAAVTLLADPFLGLLAGTAAEMLRIAAVRILWPRAGRRRDAGRD